MSPLKPTLDRRKFLRGLGTMVTLPLLESLAARPAQAATSLEKRQRMVFMYVPNGAHMPNWVPAKEGKLTRLPETFAQLEHLKQQLTFVSGLRLRGADAQGDGPGDHARSMAAFLTGAHPRKTGGKDIRNGVSVDQLAARVVADQTRLASLELGLEAGHVAGNCDSGYSCAYSSNLSWRTETSPVPKDVNPRSVFDRLFGGGATNDPQAMQRVFEERRSILDHVMAEAKSLQPKMSVQDRRKMDEYLYSVRDVERRVQQLGISDEHQAARPIGIPNKYSDYAQLMLDLLVIAFRMDATRISTFVFGNEGSNRSYQEIGISEGHHELSHHGRQEKKIASIAEINKFHASLFGKFVERLRTTREESGTLLDRTLIVYGSGIADGNQHQHSDLPIVLAGNFDGTIQSGRHVRYPLDTPLTNLYVSLLQRWFVEGATVGDSSGTLANL